MRYGTIADLSITAANVAKISGGYGAGPCGEAITIGQPVAYDSSDGKYYVADNDSGTAARKGISGIALCTTAADNQVVAFQTTGVIDIGGAITQGVLYVVSSNAGGICPSTDLGSGDEVLIVGVGSDTAERIVLAINDTNVSVP